MEAFGQEEEAEGVGAEAEQGVGKMFLEGEHERHDNLCDRVKRNNLMPARLTSLMSLVFTNPIDDNCLLCLIKAFR